MSTINIKDIKFNVIEERGRTIIAIKPDRGFYTMKISLKKNLNAEKGEELISYLKENISEIDIDLF